jgi:hypothetical protein
VEYSESFYLGNAANLVGGGAIHEVYRGLLQDGRLVAIRCQTQRGEQAEEELLTQIEINSYLSHANIVSIIGYCVEKTELILVYDFLPQGTLEDHLHGTRTKHNNFLLLKNLQGA